MRAVAAVGLATATGGAQGLSTALVEPDVCLGRDRADARVILDTVPVVFRGPASDVRDNDAWVSHHLGVT